MSILSMRARAQSAPPVWFMRQAGRYLPEYQELRRKAGSFLNLCFSPLLATEVTLQPIRRFDLDAAILFSDILVIPKAFGQDLEFVEGEGPRLGALPAHMEFQIHRLDPVFETIQRVRQALPKDKSLIGFSGAPWTVLTYMLQNEIGDRGDAKKWVWENADLARKLLTQITEATIVYLDAQVAAGVDTVQIFESWGGVVPAGLAELCLYEPVHEIVRRLRLRYPDLLVITYARGIADYNAYIRRVGTEAMGVDERVQLSSIEAEIVQGNLDPTLLIRGGDDMYNEITLMREEMCGRPYIFNLGHGIRPETPLAHVGEAIRCIRNA